jgi:hypothetical protein
MARHEEANMARIKTEDLSSDKELSEDEAKNVKGGGGHGFSSVRIHSGSSGASKPLDAGAIARGRDVGVGGGTKSELVANETAHIVSQREEDPQEGGETSGVWDPNNSGGGDTR